jgi:hypothetical protein
MGNDQNTRFRKLLKEEHFEYLGTSCIKEKLQNESMKF